MGVWDDYRQYGDYVHCGSILLYGEANAVYSVVKSYYIELNGSTTMIQGEQDFSSGYVNVSNA